MNHLKSILVIASFFFFLSLISCDDKDDKNVVSFSQTVLFEYYYINYAWGYSHCGFIVTGSGDVWSYNQPTNWNFTDKSYISLKEMNENLKQCELAWPKISAEDIEKYGRKISSIDEGNHTEEAMVGADGGSLVYVCYKYDSKAQKYKSVTLEMSGDVKYMNKSPESIEISNWLKSLFEKQIKEIW